MFKRVKVKKGDLVVVTTGDNKGKQGRVVEVNRDNDRVVVEGVNLVKKHLSLRPKIHRVVSNPSLQESTSAM